MSHDHGGTTNASVPATSGGTTSTNAIHKAYRKKYEIPLLRNIQTAEVILYMYRYAYIHTLDKYIL